MAKTSKFANAFDKIKSALAKSESSGGSFDNFMKFPAGHTYVVKLLPTIEEGKEALFHHYVNGWTSKSTGKYTSVLSRKTFGENDPIENLRWKQWKEWKEANPKSDNKEYQGEIQNSENWLINAYWVDNPSNSELNGTVQILKMGPQLKKLVDAATEGDRSDELGWDIFDPTKGFDLKIVAAKQGVYTTYKDSFFSTKSKKNLSESEVDALYENLFDLTQVYPVKTAEEIEEMLNTHYFGAETSKPEAQERKQLTKSEPKREKLKVVEEDDDEIPMEYDSDDDEVNALLEGLDED
jgi:gp32 DNA binding protein like